MNEHRSKRGSRERGVVLAWFGMLLFVVMGMAAVAVDLSYLYVSQGELQNAADAASLAAVSALKSGKTRSEAISAAQLVALQNGAAGERVELAASDVTFGSYDSQTGSFEPDNYANSSAIRVRARRTEDAPGGPVGLLFAGIWGHHSADVGAQAIASMRKRDLVITQDITFSFVNEIDDAKLADIALVNAIADQNLAGDRVGLVTFNEASTSNLALTTIPDQTNVVISEIQDVTACQSSSLPNCRGTHIAPGLDSATALFDSNVDAEKVIVLVGDGMPYPASRRQPAIDAADAADAAGINIFTVCLTQDNSVSYGGSGADAAFMAGLVRGYGKAYQTADSTQLDDLLLKILKEMPIRLVE